ncbi:MAG TPA: hypothetical protein VFS21_30215 [Roseiflexaceae bacterium]|nr:hypothetical protein [Roseiflexaceae bacterium]
MSGVEIDLANAWIIGRLASDPGPGGAAALATGGIHSRRAPLGVQTPFISIRFLGGPYTNAVGAIRVGLNGLFSVIVWDRAQSTDRIVPIAARIDARLQLDPRNLADASGIAFELGGTTYTGTILGCVAETPLAPDETRDGATWVGLGATYRIQVQQG